MSETRSIPVAIPAYQAGPFIGDVVRRACRVARQVLVIDDGSTDDTAAAAAAGGAEVLRHEANLGKGRALRTAFHHLFGRGFAHVVTLDADGQHLPENVPDLLAALRPTNDLIIGSREHLFAEMHRVRRTSNHWSSAVISCVAGQLLGDVQSGFRIYSRRLIETTGFPEPRFEAESAVVVRAVRCGFRVETVPIQLGFADGRATSHYRPIVDSLRIALAVTRARLESVGCHLERYS